MASVATNRGFATMERNWMAVNVCHLHIFIGGYLCFVMNEVAPILHLFSAAKNELSNEKSLSINKDHDDQVRP